MLNIPYTEQEKRTLNKLYEKLSNFLSPNFTEESLKALKKISELGKKAEKRALKYYSTHIDELVEDIKEEAVYNVVFLSVNYPNYTKPMLIAPLRPYLALLKGKSLELYKKAKKIIDDAFAHREEIMKSSEAKELLKGLLKDTSTQNPSYKPMPTGVAINTIIDAINAGQDGIKGIEEMPKRKAKFSHSNYTVSRAVK